MQVKTSAMHGDGLKFTFHVSVKLCKLTLCHVKQCKFKCENKYPYMASCGHVNQYKCKTNTFIWLYVVM